MADHLGLCIKGHPPPCGADFPVRQQWQAKMPAPQKADEEAAAGKRPCVGAHGRAPLIKSPSHLSLQKSSHSAAVFSLTTTLVIAMI